AAVYLRDLPGGTEALRAALNAALAAGAYADVLARIGEGEPVLPEDPNLYWIRGHAYLGLQRAAEALRDFTTVIEQVPTFAEGHSYRADVLSQLGQDQEALNAAREA